MAAMVSAVRPAPKRSASSIVTAGAQLSPAAVAAIAAVDYGALPPWATLPRATPKVSSPRPSLNELFAAADPSPAPISPHDLDTAPVVRFARNPRDADPADVATIKRIVAASLRASAGDDDAECGADGEGLQLTTLGLFSEFVKKRRSPSANDLLSGSSPRRASKMNGGSGSSSSSNYGGGGGGGGGDAVGAAMTAELVAAAAERVASGGGSGGGDGAPIPTLVVRTRQCGIALASFPEGRCVVTRLTGAPDSACCS